MGRDESKGLEEEKINSWEDVSPCVSVTLRLKMARKPYIIWSLSPKALTYESLEP